MDLEPEVLFSLQVSLKEQDEACWYQSMGKLILRLPMLYLFYGYVKNSWGGGPSIVVHPNSLGFFFSWSYWKALTFILLVLLSLFRVLCV